MKIKEKLILFFIILSFFGLSVFLALKSKKCNKLLNIANMEIILQNQKIHPYNERAKIKLYMNSEKLSPVLLLDSTNNFIPLQEFVKTSKLIFRFSDQFCKPCIEDALSSLKNLGDSIGYNNILIISDFKNSRLLKIFIMINNILSPCFAYSGKFNFEIESKSGSEKIPYYMMVDPKLNISFPFFADENDELNSIYLSRINRLFKHLK